MIIYYKKQIIVFLPIFIYVYKLNEVRRYCLSSCQLCIIVNSTLQCLQRVFAIAVLCQFIKIYFISGSVI